MKHSLHRLYNINTYRRAINWMRNFDARYTICAGLVDTEEREEPVCACTLKNKATGELRTLRNYGFCTGNEAKDYVGFELVKCEVQWIKSSITEQVPSDGVVTKRSASTLKVKPNQYFLAEEMPGSNHQQMRNDRNAGEKFRRLFDGKYVKEFKLKARPR